MEPCLKKSQLLSVLINKLLSIIPKIKKPLLEDGA